MQLKNKFTLIVFLFCFFSLDVSARQPVWQLSPVTPTTLTVSPNETTFVKYQVQNLSSKPHTLTVQDIPGISSVHVNSEDCGQNFGLSGGGQCILNLEVDGRLLTRPVLGGPVLCEYASGHNMCYRPSSTNVLRITRGELRHVITPETGVSSGGTSVTIAGTGFTGATGVTFGGVQATGFRVVDDTTITAVTPRHAVGPVTVAIQTVLGKMKFYDNYTYILPQIGEQTSGGVIACLGGGLDNLITAIEDNSASIEWGGLNKTTGAQSDTNGRQNTRIIVRIVGDNSGTPYAAQLCDNFEVDSQGNTPCEDPNVCYRDWFLGSKGQNNCLDINKQSLPGFANSIYLSSTEFTNAPADAAWGQSLGLRVQVGGLFKNDTYRVRCVKQFTP